MERTVYDMSLESPLPRLLVRLGALLSRLIPAQNAGGIFFFFPYWHVGGAEKVHADIVRCVRDRTPWVFFTHRSFDSKLKSSFAGARLFNVWSFLKYTLPFSVGLISGFINRHDKAVVFGCNSRFFYKMLPFLRAKVRRVDLTHAFGGGAEDYSLEAVHCIDTRVVINKKTREDFAKQYARLNLDPRFLERIAVIQNSVLIPAALPAKENGSRLKVLYVGRGTEEKRVHLVGKAASLCAVNGLDAEFVLVGDVENAVAEADRIACSFTGEISDSGKLADLYAAADLLVLTSSREGFPLVIMEAMAHGVVPVTTAVGGIPEHVIHQQNGFLLGEEEPGLPAEIYQTLKNLTGKPELLRELSQNAYRYACDNFDNQVFCRKYRELLGC